MARASKEQSVQLQVSGSNIFQQPRLHYKLFDIYIYIFIIIYIYSIINYSTIIPENVAASQKYVTSCHFPLQSLQTRYVGRHSPVNESDWQEEQRNSTASFFVWEAGPRPAAGPWHPAVKPTDGGWNKSCRMLPVGHGFHWVQYCACHANELRLSGLNLRVFVILTNKAPLQLHQDQIVGTRALRLAMVRQVFMAALVITAEVGTEGYPSSTNWAAEQSPGFCQ